MKLFLFKLLLHIFAFLPLSVNRLIGKGLGYLLFLSRTRLTKTTLKNIELCLPEQLHSTLPLKSCLHTGMTITESLWIWGNRPERLMRHLREINGLDELTARIAQGETWLLVGTHFGAWELVTAILPMQLRMAALYKPIKSDIASELLSKVRSQNGAGLIPATPVGMRKLYQFIKSPGALVILADQQPSDGNGVFADFFGRPALTMTLPAKLHQRFKLPVAFFTFSRTKKGFALSIKPQTPPTPEVEGFAGWMNRQFEQTILVDPAQYEWSYKRFKTQPDSNDDLYPF